MEAAEEVSRQLRLRNMGGLIVVDFIDMENSKNRLAVENKMEEELVADKSKTSVSSISKFGLMELSRQRISAALSLNSTVLTLANRILRKMHDSIIEQKVLQVHLRLPLELAIHLLNVKRQRLTQMETDFGVQISITPDLQLGPEEIPEMEIKTKEQNGEETRTSVPISAADMRDEKSTMKKGRRKKESDSIDYSDSDPKIKENKIIEDQVDTAKNNDLKSKTDSFKGNSRKEHKSVKTNNDKKLQKDQEETNTSEQKIISNIENFKKNILNEKKSDSNEVSNGFLYMSVHEPVAKQDSVGNKSSDKEYPLEENNKLENSIYSSVHTHGANYSEKEISIDSDDIISKDNLDEIKMYSSVHLLNKDLIKKKEISSKNTKEKFSKSETSKVKSPKKTTKKNQSKSINKKSDAKKSNEPDDVKKARTLKTQSDSKISSTSKSKIMEKKGTLTKQTLKKSKKSTPKNKGKVNVSKTRPVSKPK